jgi:hypothetical protein
MTLEQYIKLLQELVHKNPECLDYEVVWRKGEEYECEPVKHSPFEGKVYENTKFISEEELDEYPEFFEKYYDENYTYSVCIN